MNTESPTEPLELYRYLRTLVEAAQSDSDPTPKFALVEAYWHIGRIVVEIEQQGQHRADYGIHLIEALSDQLSQAFGKGYGMSNMWRFKQFFLAFPILATNGREFTNLRQHLRTELTWSHYRVLMSLENIQERDFYINQAADERWTVRFMQRMVRSRYYYHVGLEDNELIPDRANRRETPNGLVTGSSPTPSVVGGTKRSRLAAVKKILLERYVGFAFVGQRQYVSVRGKDFWVELVFFHIILGRFVLVQLSGHNPAALAEFRLILDSYAQKQPPTIPTLPVGLLVDEAARVKYVTTSGEIRLSSDEEAVLPLSLSN